MTLWPPAPVRLSVTSVALCFVSSPHKAQPHGVRPGTSNFLAVGCGLNNFTHGLAFQLSGTNLWPRALVRLSVTFVTLCFVSSPPHSSPHGVQLGTSNFLAVGCGLNNFAHGLAYSCRKASMGFIFAARVAG